MNTLGALLLIGMGIGSWILYRQGRPQDFQKVHLWKASQTLAGLAILLMIMVAFLVWSSS